MALSTADALATLFPYPMAIELARQMTAGSPSGGNVQLLMNVGFGAEAAKALAGQINAGAFTAHALAVAGLNSVAAKTIKTVSGL